MIYIKLLNPKKNVTYKPNATLHTKTSNLGIPWPQLIAIIAIIGLQLLGSSITNLTYLALSLWALRSPKNSIEALTLSFLISFLNPGIFTGEGSTLLRWLVLLAAFLRVSLSYINQNDSKISSHFLGYLLLFTGTVLLTSLFKSYEPLVSTLKIITFFIGSSTVILAFELTRDQYKYWEKWFSSLFLVIVIGSFPLLFHPLGYFINSTGFQGLLNQPQAYAVFLAPMLAWFTGRFLFQEDRSQIVKLGITIGLVSLFASLSRNGALAFILGFLLTLVIGIVYKKSWQLIIMRVLKSKWTIIGACLIGILLILNWDTVVDKSVSFVSKGVEEGAIHERFTGSREKIIELSWKNFLSNPLFGIGFGIASDPLTFNVKINDTLGIPLGASIEKGFLPTQILEEIGILGFTLWLILMVLLIRPLLVINHLTPLWLFLACMLTNSGEAIFFSMGGIGLYIWLLLGFSRILRN
jgi:hypothetical protein